MTRQELIGFCLTFNAVYEDYPFDETADAGKWTVMRHRANKKSFALIYERNGKLCVNLKCDPLEADFLRQMFTDVVPAYHMNKVHWNTITLNSDGTDNHVANVSVEELKRMIENSYNLIRPKKQRRKTLMSDLTRLPNIASKLERQLMEVGITSIEDLKRVGSREAWLRILARDPSACLMRLSALEGAIQGVRWHYLDDETKVSLREFYKKNKGGEKNV